MVDSISAPLDDRCAIESCRRTKDEHRHYGHSFVAASQLADLKPRPRDPFLNIRKMNDEERLGAGLPAAEGEPMVMKDEAGSSRTEAARSRRSQRKNVRDDRARQGEQPERVEEAARRGETRN
jgi:hypothetical protein